METIFLKSDAFKRAAPHIARRSSEVIFVMPYLDRQLAARCADLMSQRAGAGGLLIAVQDEAREGFISVANRVFECTESRYFGYVAQDAFPGRQWLQIAIKTMQKQNASLLAFNDGKWQGSLAAFGMAERTWAHENYDGKFFFPGYRSHYADVELTVLAISQRRYCYNPNAVLVEVDWNKDRSSVDIKDKALYHRRKSEGFNKKVSSQALLDMFC